MISGLKLNFFLVVGCVGICGLNFLIFYAYAQSPTPSRPFPFDHRQDQPTVLDPSLKIEEVVSGLDAPTTMAFLGPDDFLVLEKDKGTVLRVINGNVLDKPLLDVNVANSVERGMCGIAVAKNGSIVNVFVYFTEIDGKDGDDKLGKLPEGNRLYKYQLVNNQLTNPVLLLDLPADPGPRHNGGAIEIGPDNNIYIPVGDVDGSFTPLFTATKTQNSEAGIDSDGRSGILRITQEGKSVGPGILGDTMPLRLYYAYGVRNSFGLAFDPITGSLWDSENGPQEGDEINLVYPGFNSGWHKVYGFSSSPKNFDVDEMVTFDNRGKYEEPKMVWGSSTGLTSIIFLNSDKFGTEYKNDIFVGSVHSSRIYHFDLNNKRNDLVIPPTISNRFIVNSPTHLDKNYIFANNFGGITDLTVGPDGFLYVVSIGQGKVFRIFPSVVTSQVENIQSRVEQRMSAASNTIERNNGEETLPGQLDEQSKSIPTNNLNKKLHVSIEPLKDAVTRGGSQSITISVTDQGSRPIANAQIKGLLLYPGNNFEREFGGRTDTQGRFTYSWIIGNKGDFGELSVEVDASSPGFTVSSAVSSFNISK